MAVLAIRLALRLRFACEPRVLDLLCQISAGLPGELFKNSQALADARVSTFDHALAALDMIWASEAIGYWMLLLSAGSSNGAELAYPGSVTAEAAWLRTRAILNAVFRLFRSEDISEIVFSSNDKELVSLSARMTDVARGLKISRDELWRRFATLWDHADCADDDGFLEASMATRSVLRRLALERL